MYYLSIAIAGFGGGVVRGLVGYIKHQYSYKNVSFDIKYFFGMSAVSGIIGLLTAIAIKEVGLNFLNVSYFSPAVAFIVGYSGGDFLEGIYKIILKKQQ